MSDLSILSGSNNKRHSLASEHLETSFNRRAISVYDQLYAEDFWCPMCNEKMEEPRLLPCLHSICVNCVNEFINKNSNGSCYLKFLFL